MRAVHHKPTCNCKYCVEIREYQKEWEEIAQPIIDANNDATHITAADLAVTINARG